MKVVYGKELNREEKSLIKDIASQCGILFDTARLLYCRKIDTVDKVKEFLSPGKKHFHSPMLFNQMQSIVSRIDYARQNGETVLVCGDYDADGICATTILYNCLIEYGVNTLYMVPEREGGYGLDLNKIEEICSETIVDLIITVDCGVSEQEKIAELIDVGIDVIVTDHHEPPENLPNCLIINPKLKGCGYPFDGLSGAGVAYKLGCALIGGRADKYLDFVALATVADSMDLIGENRSLVAEGLKLFNSSSLRTAFKYLIGEGVNKQITSQTLAYAIAPRVNAGGRMGDANASIKLFTAEKQNEIYDLAVKLNTYNAMRQTKCEEIYKKAKEIINEHSLYNNSAILVANEEWSTGFVGIVAARLVEDYDKPVIVFAGHSGYYKGSARSVPEINIYNAIGLAKDCLIAYGGHSQAAGVSVEKEKFSLFYSKLCEIIDKEQDKIKKEKETYVEWETTDNFSLRFAKEINMLEPFGAGNKKPVFAIREGKILSNPLRKGSPHYVFKTKALDVLDFNGENNVLKLSLPVNKTLVYEPNYSVFKGEEQVKGYLKQIVLDEFNLTSVEPYLFYSKILSFSSNKILLDLDFHDNSLLSEKLKKLSTDRVVFSEIYSYLLTLENKRFFNSVETALSKDVPFDVYQFIFSTEVFFELKIFYVDGGLLRRDNRIKNPLTNSIIYNTICNIMEGVCSIF